MPRRGIITVLSLWKIGEGNARVRQLGLHPHVDGGAHGRGGGESSSLE